MQLYSKLKYALNATFTINICLWRDSSINNYKLHFYGAPHKEIFKFFTDASYRISLTDIKNVLSFQNTYKVVFSKSSMRKRSYY